MSKQLKCVHCGCLDYVKNGSYKGVHRYKCKTCHRAFSDKVRKFSYDDKERCLNMYLNNTGIRKAAMFMNCSHPTVIKWIREFADNLRKQLQKACVDTDNKIPDVIEMDEIYTRIKKGATDCRYGLLILDGEVKLLRLPLGERKSVR